MLISQLLSMASITKTDYLLTNTSILFLDTQLYWAQPLGYLDEDDGSGDGERDRFEVKQNHSDSVADWMREVRKEGGIKNDDQMSSMNNYMDRNAIEGHREKCWADKGIIK